MTIRIRDAFLDCALAALCVVVFSLAACKNTDFYSTLYAVTAVNNTGGLAAGAALSGTFTLTNSGNQNGTQTVAWTVYASPTATLGSGGAVIASATTAPLRAGDSSQVTFFGNWPGVSGSYYLIAVVTAPDDANQGSKFLASGALSVTAAVVNYTVTSVTYTGGTPYPASPVSGNLQFRNNGANGGTQYVTWQVYASKINTLDSSASLIASGSNPYLAAGAFRRSSTFPGYGRSPTVTTT